MLEGVIDHGTATRARALLKNTALAGKTGTSRDGWFVGYTPNLVVAVWVGFDDNEQLGMTGGEAALPIWMDFMKSAVDLRPELGGKSFAQPEDVAIVDVDSDTNQITMGSCPRTRARRDPALATTYDRMSPAQPVLRFRGVVRDRGALDDEERAAFCASCETSNREASLVVVKLELIPTARDDAC